MADIPDFEALRAKRNADVLAMYKSFAEEEGIPLQMVRSTFNSDSCYCACSSGGSCEHKWDGPDYESESFSSVTCSRCGVAAISHDMRNF